MHDIEAFTLIHSGTGMQAAQGGRQYETHPAPTAQSRPCRGFQRRERRREGELEVVALDGERHLRNDSRLAQFSVMLSDIEVRSSRTRRPCYDVYALMTVWEGRRRAAALSVTSIAPSSAVDNILHLARQVPGGRPFPIDETSDIQHRRSIEEFRTFYRVRLFHDPACGLFHVALVYAGGGTTYRSVNRCTAMRATLPQQSYWASQNGIGIICRS